MLQVVHVKYTAHCVGTSGVAATLKNSMLFEVVAVAIFGDVS
jgi:hypothetical protein